MLLSSVTLTIFTLFAKFSTGNTPYFLLIFLRFIIPFILVLPYLLWRTNLKELFITGNLKIHLLRCLSILIYQYAIFYYLMQSTLLNATVLQNTAPLFLPILEWLFFKYRFNAKVWISIIVSFIGVLCILQPNQNIFAQLSIAGILAPLGQAGSQVFFGHQARNENRKTFLFYLYGLTALVSGVIYLFSGEFLGDHTLKNYPLTAWINVLILGIVSIFNQHFRRIAYLHGKPSALSPFLYCSLIFSAILDWAIYGYLPNALSIVGAVLVIAGGVIQIYKKKS